MICSSFAIFLRSLVKLSSLEMLVGRSGDMFISINAYSGSVVICIYLAMLVRKCGYMFMPSYVNEEVW